MQYESLSDTLVNSPAVFYNPQAYISGGDLTIGATIQIGVEYIDLNGNFYSIVFIARITRDESGQLRLLGEQTNNLEVTNDLVGKTLLFAKGFEDDLGTIEISRYFEVGKFQMVTLLPVGVQRYLVLPPKEALFGLTIPQLEMMMD